MDNVLPEKDDNQASPFQSNAELIATKYPARLPEIYVKLTSGFPHAQSSRISYLLADMKTQTAAIEPLLVKAATSGGTDQRVGAFYALLTIKSHQTVDLLTARLDSMPAKAAEQETAFQPAGRMADVVLSIDEPKAWDALERLTRRSALSQRLEILSQFEHTCVCEKTRDHLIRFLMKFLSDQTVCDFTKSELADIPFQSHMGRTHLTVSEVALSCISNHLGIDTFFSDNWTNAQWNEWKHKAQDALKHYQSTGKISEPEKGSE